MKTRLPSILTAILILLAGKTPLRGETGLPSAAAANNAFALDLYARLRAQDGNLFLSPYSISTALAMTSAGASGQTAKDMSAALHLPAAGGSHALLGQLIQRYQADRAQKGYELHVANALWVQHGFPLLPTFLQLVQNNYAAQASEIDFLQPQEAAGTINGWVGDHTAGKINNLIPASALNSQTRLVLTNAIYFKGDWETPFSQTATHDGIWHSSGAEKNIPMMHRAQDFGFFEDDTLSALSLPYAGGDLEMLALLPKKADGISDLEKSLDVKQLAELSAKISTRDVVVTLPRFHMESSFDLAPALKEMGMSAAFTSDADFSGIDGKQDLLISAAVHKAYVDVDEKGTEAAAATGVMMTLGAAPRPLTFNADHPFLFLIRDVKNQTILFMGRVSQP